MPSVSERRPGGCVSLAYDGPDPSHLEVAVPCLQSHGLAATFYLEPVRLLQRARDWQAAANEGHEMGSHCLLGYTDGRGNLSNWTLETVESELRESRKLLADLFGAQSDFSFAYPGDQSGCLTVAFDPQPTSYRHAVTRVFGIARSALQGMNDPDSCDFGYLQIVDCERMDAEALIESASAAFERSLWSILVFRGVGVGSGGVDARAHEKLCSWLAEDREGRRTDTVLREAYRVRSLREAPEHGVFLTEG